MIYDHKLRVSPSQIRSDGISTYGKSEGYVQNFIVIDSVIVTAFYRMTDTVVCVKCCRQGNVVATTDMRYRFVFSRLWVQI
jgi:hypothetical protein